MPPHAISCCAPRTLIIFAWTTLLATRNFRNFSLLGSLSKLRSALTMSFRDAACVAASLTAKSLRAASTGARMSRSSMVLSELFDDVWALARGFESAARLAAGQARHTAVRGVWRSCYATGAAVRRALWVARCATVQHSRHA